MYCRAINTRTPGSTARQSRDQVGRRDHNGSNWQHHHDAPAKSPCRQDGVDDAGPDVIRRHLHMPGIDHVPGCGRILTRASIRRR